MRHISLGLLAATLLTGCAHVQYGERPHLLLRGKEWNAPILNPYPPEYGLGFPGGCIVSHEFRVDIDELTYDTATDRLRIEGQLPNGSGARFRARGDSGQPSIIVTRPDSRFSLDLLLARNDTLTIERIGMRTLHVDLRVLRRRASLAATPPPVARP